MMRKRPTVVTPYGSTTMHQSQHPSPRFRDQRGIVLPVALIMLVIISFAGLLAARNSASYEQFSNNLRTNQSAQQSAEAALRYCERVAQDKVDNEGKGYPTDSGKIAAATLASDATISSGVWNTAANWKSGATNLITVALTPGSSATADTINRYAATNNKSPSCIIQPLETNRFLITARGLSLDASLSTDGKLDSGSEVWLQSVMAQTIPVQSTTGGNQ